MVGEVFVSLGIYNVIATAVPTNFDKYSDAGVVKCHVRAFVNIGDGDSFSQDRTGSGEARSDGTITETGVVTFSPYTSVSSAIIQEVCSAHFVSKIPVTDVNLTAVQVTSASGTKRFGSADEPVTHPSNLFVRHPASTAKVTSQKTRRSRWGMATPVANT
ncbi:MAG: hypothetical protein ACLPQS_08240 [Acidimicrobiales bacterium]